MIRTKLEWLREGGRKSRKIGSYFKIYFFIFKQSRESKFVFSNPLGLQELLKTLTNHAPKNQKSLFQR